MTGRWRAAPAQDRHHLYHERFPEAAGFNIPIASLISGPVDLDVLVEAIRNVLGRHEGLRARFVRDGDRLVQDLAAPQDVPVLLHDLRDLPEQVSEKEVRRIGADEAKRPFTLAAEPVTRFHLIRVRDDETVMVFNVHHIAYDGWSSAALWADLDDQYTALVTGTAPKRPAPKHRYVDFARWQHKQIADGRYERHLDHWRAALADPPPPLPWPAEGTQPQAPWWAGDMVWLSFDQQVLAAARAAASALGTTPFVLGMAAYQIALAQVTGAGHLGVGTALYGRAHHRWDDVVGFFVSTAVMPYRRRDQTFRELVAHTHRAALAAQEHQELPYGMVLDDLRPPVAPERTPYFQTMFLVQNYPSPERKLGRAKVRSRKLVTGSARYDITCSLSTVDGETAVELENRVKLVSQDTAITVVRTFLGLLAAGAEAPDDPVSALTPHDVRHEVHRGPRPGSGISGLFDGLVADWR